MYPMKWPLDIQSNDIFIHDSPPGVLRQGAGLPTSREGGTQNLKPGKHGGDLD